MKYEVISGSYNLLPNETLARLMYENLKKVGGIPYTPSEIEFAKKLQSTFTFNTPDLTLAQQVQPFKLGGFFPASTDVGDITWVVPTVGLGTATWVPGVPAHSWQAVATGSMSIGLKAMMNAAKTITMTGIDLFNNPELLDKAKKELADKAGVGFKYQSLIGDRKRPDLAGAGNDQLVDIRECRPQNHLPRGSGRGSPRNFICSAASSPASQRSTICSGRPCTKSP